MKSHKIQKAIKAAAVILTAYFYISATYIFFHIEWKEPPTLSSPGFNSTRNAIRVTMGLPITLNTYSKVDRIYLLSVIIRAAAGSILHAGLVYNIQNSRRKSSDAEN